MTKLTDETLMAYVDGQLDDKQTKEIQKAIEADSDARKRVEVFRQSAAMLHGVYDAPLQEAVPERLMDTVMGFKTDDKRAAGLLERLFAFLPRPLTLNPASAVVAFIALLIGTGTGYYAGNITQFDKKHLAITLDGKDFSRKLDTTVSGQFFTVEGRDVQIMPVATFLDTSNRFCRQYEVVTGPDKNVHLSQGIACRSNAGNWLTIVSINSHPSDVLPGDSNTKYIPAGADDLTEVVFSQIMASPPMTLKRESELIEQKWANTSD